MRPVALFHLGPPKTATSWVRARLATHPQVCGPPAGLIHYFDMFYSRGERWYAAHFAGAAPQQRLFDSTPSYLQSPWAPRRMARHNPKARLAMCLRSPIQRAFSHYWHDRKMNVTRYRFEEVLANYDLFSAWMEPGFYAEHLARYLDHFPREQILVQRFERVESDPGGFLAELLDFYGLAAHAVPASVPRTVNVAGPRRGPIGMGLYAMQKCLRVAGLRRGAGWMGRSRLLSGRGEYLQGIPDDLFGRLVEICEPEIARVEQLLDLDLGAWRINRDHVAVAA